MREKTPAANARGFKILLGCVLFYLVVRHLIVSPWNTPPHDFHIYYDAAVRAQNGGNPYHDPEAPDSLGYFYPMFFLGLLRPLTALSLTAAQTVWWALNAGLLLAFALAAARQAGAGERGGLLSRIGLAPLAAAILVIGFLPGAETIRLGQANILVTACLLATLWLCERGRRKTAGVVFALAILCKARPLLLLPALAPALGWAGVAATAVVGALYLLTLLAAGLFHWEWYLLTVKIPSFATLANAPRMSIHHEITSRLGGPPEFISLLALGFEIMIGAAFLGGILLLWRRRAHWIWPFLWGVACVLPMSRFLEYHHLIALDIALVALFVHGERTRKIEPIAWAFSAFAAINLGFILRSHAQDGLSVFFSFAGMAFAGLGVARAALRQPQLTKPDVSESIHDL